VVTAIVVLALPLLALGIAVLITIAILDYRNDRRQREQAQAEQALAAAPAPLVDVGAAPARPAKLSLSAVREVDVGDAALWPRACSLVSDAELRAVLPQASQIRRVGAPRELTFVTNTYEPSPLDGSLLPPRQSSKTVNVPEQSCDISFQLPHKQGEQPIDPVATITVRVEAMGHPKAVIGYGAFTASERLQRFAKANGATRCSDHFGNVGYYACTKGKLTLAVEGRLAVHRDYGSDRDVEVVRFDGQPETGTAQDFYDQTVLREVMALLLRKTPKA
jgi:hypothetical protein